jgi:hypothetical protein
MLASPNRSSPRRLPSRTRTRNYGKTIRAHAPQFDIPAYLRRSSRQDELTASIRLLNTLAIQLRAKRMAAGALNLASPEVKIHLDSAETSGPIDVEQKKLLETNSLVEEFMLLANISVAQRIFDQFPQTAVLRFVRPSVMALLTLSQPPFGTSVGQF